jgi:hypothetical protein
VKPEVMVQGFVNACCVVTKTISADLMRNTCDAAHLFHTAISTGVVSLISYCFDHTRAGCRRSSEIRIPCRRRIVRWRPLKISDGSTQSHLEFWIQTGRPVRQGCPQAEEPHG